jgi:polyvinyl alcohol dehydrogenase (cytochrome)
VFAGGLDGHIRAHDSVTGNVLWDYDTNRTFQTVNEVEAKGGSIDGPGPVISDGIVLVSSGYSIAGQIPGNVLLAFSRRP